MPNHNEDETIRVPLARSVRSDVYYELALENEIVSNPERAQELAREFYRTVAPIEVPANTSIDDLTARTIFGRIRLSFVPLDLAERLVDRDTSGRARLDRTPDEPRRATLRMTGRLDQQAWERYDRGARRVSVHNVVGEPPSVPLDELRELLRNYTTYAGQFRMQYLRELVGVHRTAVQNAVKKPVRSGGGDFNTFFDKFQTRLEVIHNPFQYLPILAHGTLSSRRWGIEVEAVDIAGIKTPKYWVLKSDGSLRPEPNRTMSEHLDECATFREPDCGHSREEDGCTNDCDCGYERSANGQTSTGEWNSPVLRSIHSRGLQHICNELEGRQTNYSAGVHVHVEAGDLTPEQAAQVALLYSAWEPLFESEYHRESRDYCASLDSADVKDILFQMKDYQSSSGNPRPDIRRAPGNERYSTVNLQALQSHGTIEFRAMGNVYDYETLVRWGLFLRELLNMAKRGVPQKVWRKVKTFKDVVVLMSIYGKETPTPPWAEDRAAVDPLELLGRENRRNPNQVRHDDGVSDVFEDYTAAEPVLTDVSR